MSVSKKVADLRRLITSSTPEVPTPVPGFGTVRSLNPLRIALDSDPTTTLPYSPPCLNVYPSAVGQRVWTEYYQGTLVVIGVVATATPVVTGPSVTAGRVAKTNGLQSASGGVAVVMASDWMKGSVAFDSANGGGIKILAAGDYLVMAKGFISGVAGDGEISIRRWRAGADFKLIQSYFSKPNGNDIGVHLGEIVPLRVNDILTMKATAPASAWGDSQKLGCTITAWKLS